MLTTRQAVVAHVPTIRLWTPLDDQDPADEDRDDPLGDLTLRQCFELHLKPSLTKLAPSTIDEYYNALGHWERLMTRDPGLREINDDLLKVFVASAEREVQAKQVVGATCNKWFRHVRVILNRMGPRTHKKTGRDNKKYFSEVPFLDTLEEEELDPVDIPDDHINAVYECCKVATWPPAKRAGCEPVHWWRFSIVFLLNYGPRRHDWLWLSRSKFNMKTGEFSIRAQKTKKTHYLVFNDTVLAHLELLPVGRDLVLNPSKGNKQLYEQWKKIQAAAGIKRPDGLPYSFQDFRQTASSRYHDHAPGTAELLLGHAVPRSQKVTATHYIGKRIMKPVWKAIRSLPQPSAFLPLTLAYTDRLQAETDRLQAEEERKKRERAIDPRQKTLFD